MDLALEDKGTGEMEWSLREIRWLDSTGSRSWNPSTPHHCTASSYCSPYWTIPQPVPSKIIKTHYDSEINFLYKENMYHLNSNSENGKISSKEFE